MPQITISALWPDDSPNDPEALKACIHRQVILLGYQIIEPDDLRKNLRQFQRKTRQLLALLTPLN